MSRAPLVRLGDCCEIVSGATPKTAVSEYWGGEIAWATPKDLSSLDSKYIESTPQTLTEAGYRSCSAKIMPAGSVLFSSRAPIGHVAINRVPMCTNQGFKSFVPDPERVTADYLYYWLKANKEYLQSLGNGATFKEVSKSTMEEVRFPLPSLSQQRRIAAILDKADALRAKRRETMAKLDQLLQSVFIETFGDPTLNSKSWPQMALKSLGKVQTGSTPPSSEKGMFDGDLPFVTPGDLGGFIVEARRTLTQAGAAKSRLATAGSLLVCCIGATIGKMGVAMRDSAFNQQINAVSWSDRIVPLYGYHAMRFFAVRIAARGASTTLPILKKSEFEKIEIPVAPLELQRIFADAVNAVEQQRRQLLRSAEQHAALFASLQQRAFAGTL